MFIARKEELDNQDQPQLWKVEIGEQKYDGEWIIGVVFATGLFRQFVQDYTTFNNFLINATDWIASDGLAMLFTFIILPKFYKWLEEKNYIQKSKWVIRLICLIFAIFYIINVYYWLEVDSTKNDDDDGNPNFIKRTYTAVVGRNKSVLFV